MAAAVAVATGWGPLLLSEAAPATLLAARCCRWPAAAAVAAASGWGPLLLCAPVLTVAAFQTKIQERSESGETFKRRGRAVETALWGSQTPYIPSSYVVAAEPALDLRVARLEQDLQRERKAAAILRGDLDREHRLLQSRVTEWEQERAALRQRAESAQHALASEQRVVPQLREQWANLKQRVLT